MWCSFWLPSSLDEVQLDHIIPVSLGGPEEHWNRALLHPSCNAIKGNKLTARAIELAAEHGIPLPCVSEPARSIVADFVVEVLAAG